MSTDLEVASSYVNALGDKNLDAALALLSEDAQMASPMGLKTGKAQIRGLLEMISNMPGGSPPSAPTIENNAIVSRAKSAMGTATITFTIDSGLIKHINVALGA